MTMTNNTYANFDASSKNGQFGWELVSPTLGVAVPVILRNGIRYSPVKIVEQEIIKRYEKLQPEIFKCINLSSYYMTQAEAQLLNTINSLHCDSRYGNESFETRDVLISICDVKNLSRFFLTTETIYMKGIPQTQHKHAGVLKIFFESQKKPALVPYVIKSYNQEYVKFVSASVAEMIAHPTESCIRADIGVWDLSYMKMLSLYSENGFKEIIDSEKVIVSVDGLASFNNTPLEYQIWQGPGDND